MFTCHWSGKNATTLKTSPEELPLQSTALSVLSEQHAQCLRTCHNCMPAYLECQRLQLWCWTWPSAARTVHSALPQSGIGTDPACSGTGTCVCAQTCTTRAPSGSLTHTTCMCANGVSHPDRHISTDEGGDGLLHTCRRSGYYMALQADSSRPH